MVNSVVAGFIGIYLLMVAWGGQQSALYALVKEEVGFLKWAGAIITLSIIYNALPKHQADLLRNVVMLGFVAMLLKYGEKIIPQLTKLFIDGASVDSKIKFTRRIQK